MPGSGLFDLPLPAAVVCHDAGAANIILAAMRAHAATHPEAARGWRLLAQGPAARLWAEASVPQVSQCQSIDDLMGGAAVLLSGTGWASDLEHEARVAAAARGIRSLAVIDHWVNYQDRFVRNGRQTLPDEIIVTDEYAAEEARRCFPGLAMRIEPNLYLQALVAEIAPLQTGKSEVLYVLEPVRAAWATSGLGEFQALDYFLANLGKLGLPPDTLVRLRPHPSDPDGKYDNWVESQGQFNVRLDDAPSLAAAIGRVAWVAGCESYAMVVALHAGRKVVSTLPPRGHVCRLPQGSIIRLKELA
jgi:hypothetical protein